MDSKDQEDIKIDSQIDDKLKDISDNLDLKQAPPIHQKRLVTFFNHFVITMVDFLNSFSQSCSYRLFKFEQKINKIEAELCLLESKLSSIPEVAEEKNVISTPSSIKEFEGNSESSQPSQSSHDETEDKVEVDPVVIKYQKMVQVGVPLEAVKVKMRLEGVDPSRLNL